MAQQYEVSQESTLLAFLFTQLSEWPKKRIKQRLKGAGFCVNGMAQTRHDFALKAHDIVSIGAVQRTKSPTRKTPLALEILYQDKNLVAINKPAGLLSVGTSKENKVHALALLRMQLTRGRERVKLWPVHRLDRETSGILLFATSKEIREHVMAGWSETEKVYLAVVEGRPDTGSASITEPLRMDEATYHMHVGSHPDAKPAITHYRMMKSSSLHSLLEVQIETGRQHQIRAHMAWLGHPVVGDERYGTKGDRMGLHAYRLSFMHPVSRRILTLEKDAPQDFYALI